MGRGLALCIWILLSQSLGHAEYRAFLLRIAKKSDPQDFRLKKSTLDPLQYPHYYLVQDDEVVTYDTSWVCKGRTSALKPICQNPREIASEEGPENQPAAP